jgi:hypothetical protein
VKYRYSSLEDFLISNPLSVDGQLDDGWGALYPVKGREVYAAVLFSDISSFSERTFNLSPTETLIFVNNFFTWVTAEAMRRTHGVIDKYIGDEMMIVFSDEFGSEDPFVEAVQTARWMAENDLLDFRPHMGVACGIVTIGFVGTPLKYSCSVFGLPVTLAKRCASMKSEEPPYATITFPAEAWTGRSLEAVLPRTKRTKSVGTVVEDPQSWELSPPRRVQLKNMPPVEIRQLINRVLNFPTQSAEESAREALAELRRKGIYRPYGAKGTRG